MNKNGYTTMEHLLWMYELSLSIGRSLDLRADCEGFVKILMSRKNLTYAAVWIKNKYLPNEVDEDWATLVYAHPMARIGEKRISVDHSIFSDKEVLLVSPDEDTFVTEEGITEGELIVFALGDLGALKLFSPAKISEEEINQLKTLIPKFTTSIEGCLSYQEAIRHRDHLEERVKERTEELAESEEKFRLIFENARDAIIWADPQTGLVTNCNKATEILLEKKREEIIGVHQTKVHPPEKAEAYANMFKKHIEHKGWADDEAEVITKSGKIIPVNITASVTLIRERPIIQGIFHDISEHKRMEEEERRRAEQTICYQDALLKLAKMEVSDLETTLKRIMEIDSKTLEVEKVSFWSFSEDRSEIVCEDLYLMGKNSHERGMRLQSKHYPHYFKSMEEGLVVAADDARNDPRTNEFTQGYLIPLGITSMMDVPVRLHGKIVGIVCHEHTGPMRKWTLEDQNFATSIADMISLTMETSERKQAEEELVKAQGKLIQAERLAAAAQIASEAAHEVKNPLAVIKAGLYYLTKILPQEQEAQKTLSQMDAATERATTYINDLLNFSRPPVLALKPVDVHKVIEDALNELPKEILAGVEIEKDFASNVPVLNADPDRLKQVFANLIKNAAEAIEQGSGVRGQGSGRIGIKIEKEGEFVKISVSDTGKGVSEEDLLRIFDPFFTTKGKGTGLGLAICQRIVEAHKGEIEVKSEVGKGTTFVVKLPG